MQRVRVKAVCVFLVVVLVLTTGYFAAQWRFNFTAIPRQPAQWRFNFTAFLRQPATNPALIDEIRSKLLLPLEGERCYGQDDDHQSQFGQDTLVDNILRGRREGFYIECGAADGMYTSNTYFAERRRGWSGILIEADTEQYAVMLNKTRVRRPNAYMLNACLSTSGHREVVTFASAGLVGGIIEHMTEWHKNAKKINERPRMMATCYPLNDVMIALKKNHIDWLSLDVEGAELKILETIDFSELQIDVISLEYCAPHDDPETKKKALKKFTDFFKDKLYDFYGVHEPIDLVFTHKSLHVRKP